MRIFACNHGYVRQADGTFLCWKCGASRLSQPEDLERSGAETRSMAGKSCAADKVIPAQRGISDRLEPAPHRLSFTAPFHSASLRLCVLLFAALLGTGVSTAAGDSAHAGAVAVFGPQPCALLARMWHPSHPSAHFTLRFALPELRPVPEEAEPEHPAAMPIPLAPSYAHNWILACAVPDFGKVLADLSPNLSFAEIGMLVIGVFFMLIFYGTMTKAKGDLAKDITASVLAHLGSKHEMHIAGQPIAGTVVHPCVEKPDFDSHKEEIWSAINEIKDKQSETLSSLSSIETLSAARGERLSEVAMQVTHMDGKLNRLIGMVESKGNHK